MNMFNIVATLMVQRLRHYSKFSMKLPSIKNILIMQLGTSCVFDSPGLARNEPTPGQRSQGDSTPSVLSFFYENMVIVKEFMEDYA